MRVLFIYPNSMMEGYLQLNLAILSAVLKKAGHITSLFDTSFYETPVKTERHMKEKGLEFKKVDFGELAFKREKADIKEEFRKKIKEFNPDLIATSCVSNEFEFLLSFLSVKKEFGIPIILGGPHPTVAPDEAIASELIDMICIGEGEEALLELCEKMEKKEDITTIKNLWVKKDGKIYKNDLRPLIQDLDSLPFPDWGLFDEKHLIRPFWGKVYRFGYFLFGRGCPYNCLYCINSYLHDLYKGKGSFHREKSTKRIIDEIVFFKDKYKINFVQFADETFLAMSDDKFEEFARLYKEKINLPFYVMTRPETINERKAKILSELGLCKLISIGVETGNEELRKRICNKNFTNEQLLHYAKIFNSYGLRIMSTNMIGLPEETREDIFETIRLNKKIKTKPVIVYFFYPFKGTPLREICQQKNYIQEDSNSRPTVDSMLRMPQISHKELRAIRKVFPIYLRTPEFLWPIIRICEGDSIFGKILYTILINFFEFKLNYLEDRSM